MINLTLSEAIFLYLGAFIVFFLFIWAIYENRIENKKSIEDKEYIWYCNICGFTYIDTLNVSVSKCPRCHSYIERKEKDKLK